MRERAGAESERGVDTKDVRQASDADSAGPDAVGLARPPIVSLVFDRHESAASRISARISRATDGGDRGLVVQRAARGPCTPFVAGPGAPGGAPREPTVQRFAGARS